MATPEQSLIASRIDATDKEIELFILRLEKFLGSNLRKVLVNLKDGSLAAGNAARVLGSLKTALEAAGLKDEIAKIDAIYGKQLKSIAEGLKDFKDPALLYSDADIKMVETLIKFDESVIANKVYLVTDSLSSSIMRQVITGATIDTNSLIDDFSSATINQINAELNTATAGFYRSVTQAKAKELNVDLFAYVGPQDGITRPFCKARVNKIFTSKQIAGWDNGTNLPAGIYGGGYNCRHDLVALSKEKADQRVAEGVYSWA